MWKQIRLLTSIQTCNIYGRNESRYSRDHLKRSSNEASFLAQVMNFVFIGIASALIAAAFSFSGIVESIPVLAYFLASVVIMVFTIMQAGDTLYQLGTFELMLTMPVRQEAVITSRFLYMYVTNFIWGAVIMVPAMIVCAFTLKPGVIFYMDCIIGIIVMPFIPMVIGSLVGALVKSKTARMRHGKVISAIMTILFVIPAMILWMAFNRMVGQGSNGSIRQVAQLIDIWSGRLYPFAQWFGRAVSDGNPLYLLPAIAVSIGLFYVMAQILKRNYLKICMAVNSKTVSKNYKLGTLDQSSVLKSLVAREWRHYVSSSVYISGTLMLYVLTMVLALALLFLGPKTVEEFTGIYAVDGAFPFLVGFFMSATPLTIATFSMEGRQWWVLQSLPVRNRDIINSKLIISLMVSAPFYAATMVIGCLAIRPGLIGGIAWIILTAAYILFNTVLALKLNMKYPKLDWEDENKAMRNNTSTMVIMLLSLLTILFPAVITMIFKAYADVIMLALAVILLSAAAVLHGSVIKKSLMCIR